MNRRVSKLAQAEVRRRAAIIPLPIAHGRERSMICAELAELLRRQLLALHTQHHSVDPLTGKRVSFGLIRMANIDPLVETAQALYALGAHENNRINLCVYHARHPLLVRSGIERRLDRLLNRTDPTALFQFPDIRRLLDTTAEFNLIFVVMATAVAEVGRDHDYDWGIVEPSSMRSIIQLAGRIRRHRSGACQTANLFLLDTNIRHLMNGMSRPAFCRPGFENEHFPLENHYLSELLTMEQLLTVDASSRIRERAELRPQKNLVDLEHARLRTLMIGSDQVQPLKTTPAIWWWSTRAGLCGELQRKQPFRFDPLGRQRYALIPDTFGVPRFVRFEDDGTLTPVHDNLLHPLSPEQGPRISFWGEPDYTEALQNLCEVLQMETEACAHRFGVVDLPARGAEQGWYYHPALGFSHYR